MITPYNHFETYKFSQGMGVTRSPHRCKRVEITSSVLRQTGALRATDYWFLCALLTPVLFALMIRSA